MALIDGLISYLKLDESSGNAIDSHGSNDATLVNSPNQNFSGKINLGCDFDINDFLRDNDHPTSSNSSGTIALWVNMDSLSVQPAFVGTGSSSENQRYGSFRVESNGLLTFQTHLENASFPTRIEASTNAISTGSWYHVAVTVASSGATELYVNGTQTTSSTAEGSAGLWFDSINTTNFSYGVSERTGGNYGMIDGTMDEIGIWDRALTSSEITELYNSGSGLAYPFAVATLRLIKISGTFQDKPIQTKVAGTFVDKPIKIKVGGTFQDA